MTPSGARRIFEFESAISTAAPNPVSRGASMIEIPAFFSSRGESSREPVSTAIT